MTTKTKSICCPICHQKNTLSVIVLTQNSREYKILPDGTKAKRACSVQEDLYMDEGYILTCKNGCDVNDFAWGFEFGKLVIHDDVKFKSKNI